MASAPGESDHSLKTRCLGSRDRTADICQTVVTPAFVVFVGIGTFVKFDDESLIEKPPDGGVERSRIQLQMTARSFLNITHDRVSVPIPPGE